MLRENALNSLQKREHFGIFGNNLKSQGITKNSTSVSQEEISGNGQEFKGKWTI